MNERTIRALVEAGAVKNVLLVADGAAIHVDSRAPGLASSHAD